MYLIYIVYVVKFTIPLITHFVLLVSKYIVQYLLIKSKVKLKHE